MGQNQDQHDSHSPDARTDDSGSADIPSDAHSSTCADDADLVAAICSGDENSIRNTLRATSQARGSYCGSLLSAARADR